MHRLTRTLVTLAYDAIAAAIAFNMALLLRFDGSLPESAANLPLYAAPYTIICLIVFIAFGLHRGVMRYTSARDVIRLSGAVTLCILAATIILFLITRLENFPRTVLVIGWLLHLALAAAPRVGWRLLYDNPLIKKSSIKNEATQNALIIGANDHADLFLREINRQTPKPYEILGFLDDEKDKTGSLIHGIPVLGPIISLPAALEKLAKKEVNIDLLILTGKEHTQLDSLLQIARRRNIAVKRLPSLSSLGDGDNLTNLKPVLIEDLLGRAPHKIDIGAIKKLVSGKRVLVTGAGGSIGSELCRQIAKNKASALLMADHSEFNLYQIDQEISKSYSDMARHSLLSDIAKKSEVDDILKKFNVDIIFHAAAYKHVHLVESNPVAALKNNLFGTMAVADAATENNIKTMIIISTDKAVNPTNVMGATKRAAEIYCQNNTGETNFITVRFGNVIGSSGSAIPLFQKQIQQGGPITVTDKRAERYFMTIPEAVKLTLRAAALGNEQNHRSDVFMLDMGEPVRIWNVAEEMVRLSGLVPNVDIEIKEVGLRPGEKMKEELWYKGEQMTETELKEIFRVEPVKITQKELKAQIKKIDEACTKENAFEAITALRTLVPEYVPAVNSPFSKNLKLKTKGEK